MEDFKMDSDTANLVVQTYQKINTLKTLLNDEPYPKIKKFIDSGTALNQMMDYAMKETTKNGFELKLNSLSTHLNTLSSPTNIVQNTQQKQKIAYLLNQLKANVSLIQTKINAEK